MSEFHQMDRDFGRLSCHVFRTLDAIVSTVHRIDVLVAIAHIMGDGNDSGVCYFLSLGSHTIIEYQQMKHSLQDNKVDQPQPLYLPEELWVIIASNLWVDSLYLRPNARAEVQQQRRRNFEKLYPGALEGDRRAIDCLFQIPDVVEFFATLPESKRYVNRIAASAARHDNMPLLERMVARGANDFDWIAEWAARGGQFGIVQWAVDRGADNFKWIASEAAAGGRFEIVQWAVDEKGADNFNEIAARAAAGGRFEIVKWVVDQGANDFNEIAEWAAAEGHLEIVKWAVDQGADDFDWIAASATQGGHFEIVVWAIQQGVNNLNWIAQLAAVGGYLEIVKWAVIRGADEFDKIKESAMIGDHLDIMQWFQDYQDVLQVQ